MIWICVLLQLTTVWLTRRLLLYWVHPVVVLSLLWSILSVSSVVIAPEYYFSASAYLALIVFQLAALVGGALGFIAFQPRSAPIQNIDTKHVGAVIWLALGFGFLAVFEILRSKGNSISVLFNFSTLAETSREFSLARYEDDYRMPFLARIGQMVVFFALLVCGIAHATASSPTRSFRHFLPFTPLILIAMLLTTRATILFGSLFWLSAYISGKFFLSTNAKWQPFNRRNTIASIVGALALVAGFIWLQFMRGGITNDIDRLPEVVAHLKKWPFGSLAGFSIWYDSNSIDTTPQLGYLTFTGVFDLLGIQDRATGLFTDYVDLGDGSYGNIYTMFRGLIEDFTFVGALIVLIALGVFSSLSITYVRRRNPLGIPLLASTYPLVLFSPFVAFYSFLGHIVAVFGFFAYIHFFSKATRSNETQATHLHPTQ